MSTDTADLSDDVLVERARTLLALDGPDHGPYQGFAAREFVATLRELVERFDRRRKLTVCGCDGACEYLPKLRRAERRLARVRAAFEEPETDEE